MGQKVNPYGFRLGITTDWKSRWFKERGYKDLVIEDWKIRDYLTKQLESAAVSRIEIERNSRPHPRRHPHRASGHRDRSARRRGRAPEEGPREDHRPEEQDPFNIQEIKQPELDAALIAQGICDQLASSRGVSPRDEARHPDRAEGRRDGRAASRPRGASAARRCRRSESYREGRVPLHTLRADIDYGFREARTTPGASA